MLQFTQSVQLVAEPGEDVAPLPMRVSNHKIAEALFDIATLLEQQEANPYRVAAYRSAARGLIALEEPAAAIIARGERLEVPGLGERLRRKITELVTTGRMTFADELHIASLPADVRALLVVPHVGPRTALRLSGEFDIHSVTQLLDAATHQRLRNAYGFGPRSETRLAAAAREALARTPHAA